MRRLSWIILLLITTASLAQAQNPCAASGSTRTVFTSTATAFPIAVESLDHADTNKVSEYVIDVYPAGGTTSLNQQVVARSAATLVAGTTNCYRMTVTRAAPLLLDTDYAVRVLARGPAGEGVQTSPSNPFVFTSPARLGNVRVTPAP